VPGPLSSSRPYQGDNNLTGGPSTSVGGEFIQRDRELRRTTHMAREARTSDFEVDGRPPTAKKLNQKSPSVSNLRTKAMFVARRKRK